MPHTTANLTSARDASGVGSARSIALPDRRVRRIARHTLTTSIALVASLAAACSDEITLPSEPVAGHVTVDASARYAFLGLAEGGSVEVSDPSASSEWDMAFFSTTVSLNGGEAGPAGIVAHCICQNASATNEEVLAMTAESERADFDAVDAGDIPAAASAWSADVLTPAIRNWVTGTGAQATPAASAFWKLRLDDGTSFAKLRVTSIANATATHAGTVTIEFAVQPSDAAPFGTTRTLTVDVAAGPVSIDLNGAEVTQSGDWDIRVEGWAIRVNSGISGSGAAGAASPADGETFASLTTAVTAPQAYIADRHAGVFGATPWYRYNLTGQHRVHPTFDVYLVRRGNAVYKVQLTGYYGPAGEARRIGVRYEQIAG